jgi:hypothetical protein
MKGSLFKTKKSIVLFYVCIVLTIVSAIFFLAFNHLGNILTSQQAAERYRGDSSERYAQVTAFFPNGKEVKESDIFTFRMTIDSTLVENSIEAEKGESLYEDAYSGTGEITVVSDRASATVTAIGVGGNFFDFHPIQLKSGSYFSGNDLMDDYVILDEELAWKLFGGTDLAGLTVSINDEPYVIAGVISREDDFASEKAYTDGAGLFMSYNRLNDLTGNEITSYELVCVNPIKGFALSLLEKGFSDSVSIENSGRFSISGIFDVLRNFGTRSMRSDAVIFPYWENAARYVESVMAIVLAIAILFAIVPAVTVVVIIVKYIRRFIGALKKKIPEAIDQYGEDRYRKKQERRGS